MARVGWLHTRTLPALLFAAACASPSPAASSDATPPETLIFFPRWRGLDGFPAAEAEGTLIERAGCLFLRWDAGTADLLLWPPDARPVDAGGSVAVADGSGRIRAAVGQHVRFGGGQYGPEHRSFVEQRLIGMAVPEPCAGTYWLVSPD